MTHLPYIAASYGLFVATALVYAVGAMRRLSQAAARLKSLDTRGSR